MMFTAFPVEHSIVDDDDDVYIHAQQSLTMQEYMFNKRFLSIIHISTMYV